MNEDRPTKAELTAEVLRLQRQVAALESRPKGHAVLLQA